MKPAIGDKVTTYLGKPATIVDTDGNGRYKSASGLWWIWDGEALQEAEAPETALMFELDVSRVYRNKEGYEAGGYKTNTSFKTETHTPESFVETVLREGYPLTMKHAKRSPEETGAAARGVVTAKHTENFISAQLLVGDDDHKETGGAAWWLRDSFFSRCGFAFAESASSTPERQKGHAIFLFDRPITDPALYKECLQALCSYYPRLDWLVNVDRTIYSAQGAPVHLLGNICPFAEFEREVLAPHRADEAEKRAALEARQAQRRAEYARARGATVSQDQEERYLAGFLDWLFRHVADTARGDNRNRKVYWAGREIAGVEASTWAQPYLHLLSDVDARIVEAATANGYLDEHANGNADEVLRVFNRGRLAGGEPIDPPMPRVTAAPSGSASTATPQASANGAGPAKASAQDGNGQAAPHVLQLRPEPGGELYDEYFEPLVFLIADMLAKGQLTVFGGRPKGGKSWLMLQMAQAVDTGRAFLGRAALPARVLYIALEDGRRRIHQRLHLLKWKPANAAFLFGIAYFDGDGETGPGLDQLAALAGDYDLIVIDTLIATLSGRANENDNVQMGAIVNELARIAHETDTAIVLIHHTGKGASDDPFNLLRGASAIRGGYDLGLLLERKQGEREALLHVESRDFESFSLTIQQADGGAGWEALGDGRRLEEIRAGRRAYEAMRDHGDPATTEEVAKLLGVSRPSALRQLHKLEEGGTAKRTTIQGDSKTKPYDLWELTA